MERSITATGTVTAINPATNTATVLLTAGGILYNVGMLNSMGGPFSTDRNPMPNMMGATVVLMLLGNTWRILGTVPGSAKPDYNIAPSPTDTGTGTDNKDTYGKTSPTDSADLSQGRSTAIQANDKVLSTDGGSEVLLGSEGLVLLKASPLAQFMLGSMKDFAKLVAREIFIYSDFGKIEFTGGGPKGRTGLNIYGGATYCDESSTNEPIWTVRQMIGDVPGDSNARYYVRVNSTDLSKYVTVTHDTAGCNHTKMSHDTYNEVGRDAQFVMGRHARIAVGYDPESAGDKVNDNLFLIKPTESGELSLGDKNTFPETKTYYDRRPNELGTSIEYPDGTPTREKDYQEADSMFHILTASDFLMRVGDEKHVYVKSHGVEKYGGNLHKVVEQDYNKLIQGNSKTEVVGNNEDRVDGNDEHTTQGEKKERVFKKLTVETPELILKVGKLNITRG